MKNKSTSGSSKALMLVMLGTLMVLFTLGAASLNSVSGWNTDDGLQRHYVVVDWPLSTDASYLLTLPSAYGTPIAYRHIIFQDQDLPAGGDAGTSTGVVANKQEHTFVDIEAMGGTGISAYQITVYKTEFDGTVATQESTISIGEFIYSPIDGDFFDEAL